MNETTTQRGLVIMSALLNFADWLNDRGILADEHSPLERGNLVREFLANHSDGENYFLQAEEIAERLGVPFRNEGATT